MTSNFQEWKAIAQQKGYNIEQEGNHFIAHINGVEKGEYVFYYACASGHGWFMS